MLQLLGKDAGRFDRDLEVGMDDNHERPYFAQMVVLMQRGNRRVQQEQENSTNLYPPTKGYLRETCKSQNINPIYLTLSSPSVLFRS